MDMKKLARFRGKNSATKTTNLDEALRRDIVTDVHKLPINQVLDNHEVDPKRGLATSRAKELWRENGPNALTPPKKSPEILKLVRYCCGGFSLLIWVSKS